MKRPKRVRGRARVTTKDDVTWIIEMDPIGLKIRRLYARNGYHFSHEHIIEMATGQKLLNL